MEYRSQIKPLYGTRRNPLHWANQGLVGAWDMLEGSGLIAHDSSGNGNDGALVNMSPMSPTSGWVPGPHGPALAFNGSNDYVRLSSSISFSNKFTVVFFVNTATPGEILSLKPSTGFEPLRITFISSSFISIQLSNSAINREFHDASGLSVPANSWIGYTFDNGLSCIYVGPRLPLRATKVMTSVYSPVAVPRIGTRDAVGNFTSSLIFSVSIYNRALSAEEISYLNAFPWCGYEDEKGMQEWLFNQNATAMQQIYRFYSIGAGR